MTEEEIKNLLQDNIDDAYSFVESDVNADRKRAMEYYLRQPYGNEVTGKSSVVTGEVAESIDGALPQLMKVFTQNTDVVEFTPQNDGDATVAENVTQYINHIFNKDNAGAIIMHNWFFDALTQKTGIVKAYWNDEKDVNEETYKGLSQDELTELTQDDTVEIISQEVIEIPLDTVDNKAQMTNEVGSLHQDIPEPIYVYNVKLRTTLNNSRVKIENVPPADFMIDRHADNISDARFVAQRKMLTRAELVAMGYDQSIVDDLSTDGDIQLDSFNPITGFNNVEANNTDKTQDLIATYECYLDIGEEDGLAKKHRVCYASNTILSDEEIDYVPFYSLCPFPIPHAFYGQSMADRTMELQFIKSTITRQMLDNLYLTNNSRVGIVEGQCNIDDVLNSTAGGVIRMKNPNAIVPLTVQSSANQSFPFLEYLDQVQAKRTGVSDMMNGLDPNVLQNVSATAVAAMTQQSQGKLELMARVFADTGVKNLMQGLLHLVCKYQDEPRAMAINGKPMNIDPREWTNLYNVNINVGLGNGRPDEKIAMLNMVMAKQEMILQQYGMSNPLVNLKQYRDTLAKFINASGYRDDSQFMNEISDEELAQIQQQDAQADKTPPEVQAAQAIAKAETDKAQMKSQTDMAAQQLKMQEMHLKTEIEQQKLALERQQQELDSAKEMLKIQTERAKLDADIQLREVELKIKEEALYDKSNSDDMKNMINAVDKISKING